MMNTCGVGLFISNFDNIMDPGPRGYHSSAASFNFVDVIRSCKKWIYSCRISRLKSVLISHLMMPLRIKEVFDAHDIYLLRKQKSYTAVNTSPQITDLQNAGEHDADMKSEKEICGSSSKYGRRASPVGDFRA
ncbi:unnamed protein product [Somion occarium]|uniref:Uncharacterized protein n=1 Tax=Somion occarium TaxID=3059160 RepID=A0ABP1E5A6_9APHY